MKALKILLLLTMPSHLMAADYIFKVDDKLESYVSDTISFDGSAMEAYQDAKVWFMEQKWTAQTTYDSIANGFGFNATLNTKLRYNPIIHTSYADFVTFDGNITIEGNKIILLFNHIQFGESVVGIGQRSSAQPIYQKMRKLEKEKKARLATFQDESLDKKSRKKKLSDHDDVIEDIESSLQKVDEELRLRLQNLKNAI